MSELEARRFDVRGRVQGVGFRAATVRSAQSFGLVGWVQNTDDGGVTIVAQGTPDSLAALARWVQAGPPWARVDGVSSTELDIDPGLQSFEIRW